MDRVAPAHGRADRAGVVRGDVDRRAQLLRASGGLPRSPLLAFNVAGVDPFALAEGLDREGVEARAGCHCATLAHRDLGLTRPPAAG